MADPLKIEVGDTVAVLAFPSSAPIQAVVLAIPINAADYWRMRMTGINATIFYVSLSAPIITLVQKGP